ncbi:DapH/DapD/GlmU-related protein [Rhodococcus sp. USK13]|uniref:acyltransferase n=1 Tax=Rhodococcus sp. USK13 TaxID=2806442 RepID=UPI0020171397|nr:DapH/DapD/GlmU-related protein [Rhodococcus sp. USK13]
MVGDGCWIGAGAIILPGVTVGEGCVVGAGAVVTRDCSPNGLYVGSPARRVRDLDTESSVG